MSAFVAHQHCPRCSGAINVEHCAAELLINTRVTLLYCEFCGVGWETLWNQRGTSWVEDFSCEFSREKDPVALGKFLQRLKDRRCAA